MEEDTLLIQTVPARVALRHYSQEKMGGGGGGGGWQQTIHDKPENTMSILIICLTGSSLNVQHSNCFFPRILLFSLQQYEQPAKHHMTYFHCVAFSTALRAPPSDAEPRATVHD